MHKRALFLQFYVTGETPFCEGHLHPRRELEMIDIHQESVLAKGEPLIAALTLIKPLPLPLRRIIDDDVSDKERVLVDLDLRPHPKRRISPRNGR